MESVIDLNVKTIDSMVYALKDVPTRDEVSVLKECVTRPGSVRTGRIDLSWSRS